MRVLIVEDEVAVARQIASALTEAGHDPKAVHDGEAALDEVRKTPFDLIVLDIRLLPSVATPPQATPRKPCIAAHRARRCG